MKRAVYILPLLLAACASPAPTSQRVETIGGNRMQFTSGSMNTGRYITVSNVDKRWEGRLKGGKEKWKARTILLNSWATQEIRSICGEWFYHVINPPVYKMMDKDDTMGGMAPVLGIAASMAAHLAADAATDPANVPVSVYIEFSCPRDEK